MVICDNCGTDKDVRRSFMTMWNGSIIDLCKHCWPLVGPAIDAIWLKDPTSKPPP